MFEHPIYHTGNKQACLNILFYHTTTVARARRFRLVEHEKKQSPSHKRKQVPSRHHRTLANSTAARFIPAPNPSSLQVCHKRHAGYSFFICFSGAQETYAKAIAGRVLAPGNTFASAGPAEPSPHAVIFEEGDGTIGRPAVNSDRVNGAGARVLGVSDWVGLYGEYKGSELFAFVYP